MSILSSVGNIYFVYQFIKKLVTPFDKTKAFELGIIDGKGRILKKDRTKQKEGTYERKVARSEVERARERDNKE